jgi:hypothetical protein
MPRTLNPWDKVPKTNAIFDDLYKPIATILPDAPALAARGDRPLQMEFEHQLKALILFHLEEHSSAQHLLQVLKQDVFARTEIAPAAGIEKSSFSEAMNTRGFEQLSYVFEQLQIPATKTISSQHSQLGDLIAIDGSLIDAVLSMYWADYRGGSKKAKAHVGFDLNRAIPRKLFLTEGTAAERPFVSWVLSAGQTGVMDRGYQCHRDFDALQTEDKYFVCRIKKSTHKTVIQDCALPPGSSVFSDARVLLGTPGINQTEKELRVVGYMVAGIEYFIATNRFDLSAEEIAHIYKLRWEIEKFFAWWKRHLKVYHLIARSPYGLLIQLLAGLITYLLLAIYCHEHFHERVTIKRVREIRIKLRSEARAVARNFISDFFVKDQLNLLYLHAKT